MPAPRPYTLVAELTYQCPLHCPYCSNPLDIGGEKYRSELETEHWARTFREARGLGVLQLALTGGEPMLRRDLVELCAGSRDAGLYSSLITAGTLFTRERAEALKLAGLDHVQISIQSPNAQDNDRIAGNKSFEKKIAAARLAKELDFPLTINCVLHRQNLDRIAEVLDLALDLGAQRLELANTQYYGWAVANQEALLPSWEQLRRGEEAVRRFRERVGPKLDVLWVLPDFYEELPVLGASRSRRLGTRVSADERVRLSHDETAGAHLRPSGPSPTSPQRGPGAGGVTSNLAVRSEARCEYGSRGERRGTRPPRR